MPLVRETVDAVVVLRMDDGENRFNPTTLTALEAEFDAIEQAEGPRAAVLTGTGKFFSNGLDLDWMGGASTDEVHAVVARVQELMARLLLAPFATVAALNGHAFAAGAMLATACDERVMREDRGYFCFPEVDLGLPFTEGMQQMITGRLSPQAAHRTMALGARLPAAEALALGVADATAPEERVVADAVARAAALAPKAGASQASIKAALYGPAAATLRALDGSAAAALGAR